MTFKRWLPTFLAFPAGGFLAEAIGGVEGPVSAAACGLIAGAVIGAAQWLALRDEGIGPRWIAHTAAAMAAGSAVAAAATGAGTEMGDLVATGLIAGAAVGAAQAPLLSSGAGSPGRWRHRGRVGRGLGHDHGRGGRRRVGGSGVRLDRRARGDARSTGLTLEGSRADGGQRRRRVWPRLTRVSTSRLEMSDRGAAAPRRAPQSGAPVGGHGRAGGPVPVRRHHLQRPVRAGPAPGGAGAPSARTPCCWSSFRGSMTSMITMGALAREGDASLAVRLSSPGYPAR